MVSCRFGLLAYTRAVDDMQFAGQQGQTEHRFQTWAEGGGNPGGPSAVTSQDDAHGADAGRDVLRVEELSGALVEDHALGENARPEDDEPEDDEPEDDEPEDDDFLAEGQRLLSEAEAKLAAVERALARLDSGAYGLCEVCNEPIEPSLLAEYPSCSRCEQHGGVGT
jgi:DnaK suppressor protein